MRLDAGRVLVAGIEASAVYVGVVLAWPLAPLVFDGFTTPETVGPRPWWESGGPTGTVQPREVPYKSGFAFKALADIELHGARIWQIADQGDNPTDHTPKLCVGPASATPATAVVAYDDTQPSASSWLTVMFDAPVPIPADAERVIWIVSVTGSNAPTNRQIARSDGGMPGEVTNGSTSLGGLMQALDPQGWFSSPMFGGEAELEPPPFGRTGAYYWLDPLVTAQ